MIAATERADARSRVTVSMSLSAAAVSGASSILRKSRIRRIFSALSVMTTPLPLASGEIEPQEETMRTTALLAAVGSRYSSGSTSVTTSPGRTCSISASPLRTGDSWGIWATGMTR